MIWDLYQKGLNISQIARRAKFHRNTVRKHLAVQSAPIAKTRKEKQSKLGHFKGYFQQRISEYPISADRIFREIQSQGFTGGYTIVRDYIRKIRPSESIPTVLRYETKPGIQAQVDWAEYGRIDVDGTLRKLYCFSIILGYSRMRYMEFTLSTDVFTFIQCHSHSFEFFGGITKEILYDNVRQVLIKRQIRPKEHTWNSKFEDFFSHYGFIPQLCKPYCPHTKGKVENSIGYMKRDLLLGGTFRSLDDINQQLLQ